MNDLLIVGAGSFSVEVEEMARLVGFDRIAFLDDNLIGHSSSIIGRTSDLSKFNTVFSNAIVALGNNELRRKFHLQIKSHGYTIPILVHPTAFVSDDAELSAGCIVRAHAVISRYAHLDEGVIVNVGGLIDHHCVIHQFSHILMGAVIRNSMEVPELSWIDANSVIE
ncbi:hypothetical protein [Ruminococcus flavefaciens]|uniref:PglD-related sugar-binding protein n=1 Tax=Ruminococcus flavefaciens TaxID=1265 RepID=UPI0026F2F45C|nr:hypothetical protein [Ruminococcus flavefaciens]